MFVNNIFCSQCLSGTSIKFLKEFIVTADTIILFALVFLEIRLTYYLLSIVLFVIFQMIRSFFSGTHFFEMALLMRLVNVIVNDYHISAHVHVHTGLMFGLKECDYFV